MVLAFSYFSAQFLPFFKGHIGNNPAVFEKSDRLYAQIGLYSWFWNLFSFRILIASNFPKCSFGLETFAFPAIEMEERSSDGFLISVQKGFSYSVVPKFCYQIFPWLSAGVASKFGFEKFFDSFLFNVDPLAGLMAHLGMLNFEVVSNFYPWFGISAALSGSIGFYSKVRQRATALIGLRYESFLNRYFLGASLFYAIGGLRRLALHGAILCSIDGEVRITAGIDWKPARKGSLHYVLYTTGYDFAHEIGAGWSFVRGKRW